MFICNRRAEQVAKVGEVRALVAVAVPVENFNKLFFCQQTKRLQSAVVVLVQALAVVKVHLFLLAVLVVFLLLAVDKAEMLPMDNLTAPHLWVGVVVVATATQLQQAQRQWRLRLAVTQVATVQTLLAVAVVVSQLLAVTHQVRPQVLQVRVMT